MSAELKDSIIRTGNIDAVANKDDLDNEVFSFDDINGVKINESPNSVTFEFKSEN